MGKLLDVAKTALMGRAESSAGGQESKQILNCEISELCEIDPAPDEIDVKSPAAGCTHCGGTGVCDCPSCTLRRSTDPAPCCMCGGQARRIWLASPRWWEPGAVCWECKGTGKCRCIVCAVGSPFEPRPGPCTICRGSGRVPERVQ
jgi:hypothetical protein